MSEPADSLTLWGDKMSTITVYNNQECTDIAGSGFVGEYTKVRGAALGSRQTYDTHTINEKSVGFWQLINYGRSSVTAFSEATTIPINITPTAERQYLYFTPKARIAFYCYGSSHNFTFTTYAFQMDFGSGFENVTTWEESVFSSRYDIRGIAFRTGGQAYTDTDLPLSGGTDTFGIDLVTVDNQGREQVDRCVMGLTNSSFFLEPAETPPYKPKTGNKRKGGTGTGYYPNNPIPALPTGAINSAFSAVLGTGNGLTYYKLTGDCLEKITEFLYDCGLTLKFRNSQFRDCIASLIFIPYNVSADVVNSKQIIYLANRPITPNSACDFITNPLKEINFGSVDLMAENIGYKNYADIIHTSATLYLPCFGAVNIDMSAIANGRLLLRGVIDVRNGNILYRVETQSMDDETPVLYGQYNGNCGIPVPIGGTNSNPTILGAISSIGTVGVGVASGNPLQIISGLSGLAQQTAPDIDTSGAMQPACAALGTPSPILQIKKRVLLSPPQWGEINGKPSAGENTEEQHTVADYSGFLQCAWCDVSGIAGATEDEKAEIERLLKEGVFL